MKCNPVSILYYLCLCSWMLPAGIFLNIPIRILLYLVLCLLIMAFALKKKAKISKYSIYLTFIVCLANLWDFLSLINNQVDCILSFNKELISLVLFIVITDIFIKNHWVTVSNIFKVLKFTSVIFVFIKLFVELSLLLGITTYSQCMHNWELIFSGQFTPGYLFFGNITLYRIETANDFIPLIVLLYDTVFCKNKIGKKGIIFNTILIPIYLVIVNTRIIIIHFFAILLCLWCEKTIKKRGFVINKKQVVCFFVVIFILIFSGKTLTPIYNSIIERFSHTSAAVEYSDYIRVEQFQYLVSGIGDSVLLGHGLASYVPVYLRDPILKYKYELEYLSYIYQFGIIGFILLIGSLIYIFYRLIIDKIKYRRLKVFLVINYLFWAIRPLVNPHFLSSNSGMCIVCLYVLGLYYIENNLQFIRESNKGVQKTIL